MRDVKEYWVHQIDQLYNMLAEEKESGGSNRHIIEAEIESMRRGYLIVFKEKYIKKGKRE